MNDNGDGSWSITLSLEAATYEFKFQNGLDGWEELECGGNRSVVVELGAPVSVQGCFAQCSEVCAVDPDPADVTFQVDASQIEVSADGMFLMGSFTEPAWQFGAIAMNDDDGDGIRRPRPTSPVLQPSHKFNNGAPVVEDVAVYDGEESGDSRPKAAESTTAWADSTAPTTVLAWPRPSMWFASTAAVRVVPV